MTLTSYMAGHPSRVTRVSVAAGDPEREFETAHARFAPAKRLLLRRAYRDADRVIAVSDGVRRKLVDFYGIPHDKVSTCYNIFDVQRIDALSGAFSPEWEKDCFHVVSVGRLQAEKGHLLLLKAAGELVNRRGLGRLRLTVLGQGPMETELKEFASAHRLDSVVRWPGFQENPFPWIRGAHLLCLPSLYEGMPNVLVEAMLCRTPVLSTDCPSGPREILENGALGTLVPPGDSGALADGIADAMLNYESWSDRVDAARRHAEISFSVDRGISSLEDVLVGAMRGNTGV